MEKTAERNANKVSREVMAKIAEPNSIRVTVYNLGIFKELLSLIITMRCEPICGHNLVFVGKIMCSSMKNGIYGVAYKIYEGSQCLESNYIDVPRDDGFGLIKKFVKVFEGIEKEFQKIDEKTYEQGFKDGEKEALAKIAHVQESLDNIKKAEYDRGFKAGHENGWNVANSGFVAKMDDIKKSEYSRGFNEGYEKGRRKFESRIPEKHAEAQEQTDCKTRGENLAREIIVCKEAYNKGLEAAWNAARKIMLSEENGGMNHMAFLSIFEKKSGGSVLSQYSVAEVIEKIKAYEKEQSEKGIKSCQTCDHHDVKTYAYPCVACQDYSNWEQAKQDDSNIKEETPVEPKSATVELINEVYADCKYNFELTDDVYDEIMYRCDSLEVDDIRINIEACLDYIRYNGFRAFVREEDDGKIWEYCVDGYRPKLVTNELHLLLVGHPENINQVSIIGKNGSAKTYGHGECLHEIPGLHAGEEIILCHAPERVWGVTDKDNPGEIIGKEHTWCRIKVPESIEGGETLILDISDKYGCNTNCDCICLENSFSNREDIRCENFPVF